MVLRTGGCVGCRKKRVYRVVRNNFVRVVKKLAPRTVLR